MVTITVSVAVSMLANKRIHVTGLSGRHPLKPYKVLGTDRCAAEM